MSAALRAELFSTASVIEGHAAMLQVASAAETDPGTSVQISAWSQDLLSYSQHLQRLTAETDGSALEEVLRLVQMPSRTYRRTSTH
jgi:hypothetical protein